MSLLALRGMRNLGTAIGALLLFTGCGGNKPEPVRPPPEECRYQVDEGYKELDKAKSGNPAAMADIMRATGYLSSAAVQRQFDKFPECIEQAKRARELIKPYIG